MKGAAALPIPTDSPLRADEHDVVPRRTPVDCPRHRHIGRRSSRGDNKIVNGYDTWAGAGHTTPQTARVVAEATPTGEQDLAWDLVMCCRGCLSIAELNTVFVKLGCGEHVAVIETALRAVVGARATVPSALSERLRRWVRAYDGHGYQHRLHGLIEKASQAGVARRSEDLDA